VDEAAAVVKRSRGGEGVIVDGDDLRFASQ
jgi:hypothetical protein